MARITVDVNEEWLADAQEVLGTPTKVATINAALEALAWRKKAQEALDALDAAELDFSGSAEAWRYGGGRDLSPEVLIRKAREAEAASRVQAS